MLWMHGIGTYRHSWFLFVVKPLWLSGGWDYCNNDCGSHFWDKCSCELAQSFHEYERKCCVINWFNIQCQWWNTNSSYDLRLEGEFASLVPEGQHKNTEHLRVLHTQGAKNGANPRSSWVWDKLLPQLLLLAASTLKPLPSNPVLPSRPVFFLPIKSRCVDVISTWFSAQIEQCLRLTQQRWMKFMANLERGGKSYRQS